MLAHRVTAGDGKTQTSACSQCDDTSETPLKGRAEVGWRKFLSPSIIPHCDVNSLLIRIPVLNPNLFSAHLIYLDIHKYTQHGSWTFCISRQKDSKTGTVMLMVNQVKPF